MNRKTLVVNLFAGPGCGKSTNAAGIFYHLKMLGINCEMAREYAKNVVWKEAYSVLHDQNYIFSKQLNILHYLDNKVEVVITDSPLLFSLMYGKGHSEHFKNHVLEQFNNYDNMNILLERRKIYNPKGRMQTEEEAKNLDVQIKNILEDNKIEYVTQVADSSAAENLARMIFEKVTGKRPISMITADELLEGNMAVLLEDNRRHTTTIKKVDYGNHIVEFEGREKTFKESFADLPCVVETTYGIIE